MACQPQIEGPELPEFYRTPSSHWHDKPWQGEAYSRLLLFTGAEAHVGSLGSDELGTLLLPAHLTKAAVGNPIKTLVQLLRVPQSEDWRWPGSWSS